MNTGFTGPLRMNNATDFRYSRRTKAKSATSCGNAFVTNILLASAGVASASSSLRKHMLLRLLVAKTLVKQSLTNVFPAGSSPNAFPAGVADFHFNQ